MRRPWVIPLLLLVLVAGLGWVASVRLASETDLQNGEFVLAAVVRAEQVSVLAPSLAFSLATSSTAGSAGTISAASTGAGGSTPAVAGTLASVEVSAGAHVEAGQVLARLDDTALRLRLDAVRAAARGARAQVGVVDETLTSIEDSATTLADARTKLDATLTTLAASRTEVAANLAQARAAVASMPPTLPPGAQDPRVLVAELEVKLAQIDEGLANATTARSELESATATIGDAQSQLQSVRSLGSLVADAADAGVAVAEARLALAVIRAPSAGTVTWVAERGTVLFAGGPIARLNPDGPLLLDTYLDASQASLVHVGSLASAGIDSLPGLVYPGRVSAIDPVYEYPPTALPTRLIHMTRAFRVTVSLDDTAAPLPVGTPADLTISTRS